MTVILLGLLTGIDNFIVSLGLGTAQLSRRKVAALIAAIALAEAAMPLVGFAIASLISIETVEAAGPALLLLAGALAAWRAYAGIPKISSWFLLTIPPIMSLDNLALGAGMGTLTGFNLGAAAVAGLIAASVSTLGISVGRLFNVRSPATAQSILAACLVSMGMFELVGG